MMLTTTSPQAHPQPATARKRDPWANVPREITERVQWVCWRYELDKKGKPTKVPYTPNTTRKAASNRASTWRTFKAAVECHLARPDYFDGIGYVFSADDPYVGGDIDHCVTDGVLSEDARQLLPRTYAEISPSESGVKFIARANGDYGRKTKRGELYSSNRFFTITGNVLPGHTLIATCQEAVEAFAAALGSDTSKAKKDGTAGDKKRAELVKLYTEEFKSARRMSSNPNAVADLKRRLNRATREGTQLALSLSGDFAGFHQRWPFVGIYRADDTLDSSQVRAVVARGIIGRGFSFPEYVTLFVDHFKTECSERWSTKQALQEELAGLWQDAIDNINYTPRSQHKAVNEPKRDVQEQPKRGKDWRAGEHRKTIEQVYTALESYRAGEQAIIQIGALVADLSISRRTVITCLDELVTAGRIEKRRLAGGSGLLINLNPKRDVQQHIEQKVPVLVAPMLETVINVPVCIEETHVDNNNCVSSNSAMLDHISLAAESPTPTTELTPAPLTLAELVSEAIEAFGTQPGKMKPLDRVKAHIRANGTRQWSDAAIEKEYRWQLTQRRYSRNDVREAEKARALGGEALRKKSRAIAGAAAQMHRKGDKRAPIWDRRAGIYAQVEAERQQSETERIASIGYSLTEQADMLTIVDRARTNAPTRQPCAVKLESAPIESPAPIESHHSIVQNLIDHLKAIKLPHSTMQETPQYAT